MNLKANCQKFKRHLETGGLFYAIWRGLSYFIFLIKSGRDRFKQQPNIIVKGKLKLICSDGGINIFWNGSSVSKGAGLNIGVNTLGLWTDSTKADWQILERSTNHFKIKIIFKSLPLNQIWSIDIENEQEINWQVNTEIEEWLHIDEFRIVCMVNPRYKTWLNNYQQSDFPRLSNQWVDFCLEDFFTNLVGVRLPSEGEFLPSLIFQPHETNLRPLIQNPPLNIDAHIVGFRCILSEEKRDYSPGHHHIFTGKINLFVDDYLLDSKIENLRRDSLNIVINEKTTNKRLRRKLRILLANLPWQKQGKWGVRAGSRWPHIKESSEGNYLPFPFFLAYATSLLQKHDIKADMIDAIAEQIPEHIFIEKVLSMNSDYLVAETSVPSFYDDLRILEKVRKAGIRIILCGPNALIYEPQFLKNHAFIDFVLYGEYEFTLLDLAASLEEGRDLSGIGGLIYKDDGAVIKNHKRDPFDINFLPWPHRETPSLDKYWDLPGNIPSPSVQMLASRGCPFGCNFCLWPQVMYQGNHYRARDIKDVIDEMEYLVRNKGFKSVYFDDDTFNFGKGRMLEFCNAIKKRNLHDIPWAIMARPDLMDEEILKNMKEAGLWAVKYGVESCVQSQIENSHKNMDLEKSYRIINLTKNLGIKVHLTFCFGLAGETKETIQKSIDYALNFEPDSLQFSILTPFPGTSLFNELDSQGKILSKDWTLYDGHYHCVFRPDNLAPQDLEKAKRLAYRLWGEYIRKKRGFLGDISRFKEYFKKYGFKYTFSKTKDYLAFIWIRRKQYLNGKD